MYINVMFLMFAKLIILSCQWNNILSDKWSIFPEKEKIVKLKISWVFFPKQIIKYYGCEGRKIVHVILFMHMLVTSISGDWELLIKIKKVLKEKLKYQKKFSSFDHEVQ